MQFNQINENCIWTVNMELSTLYVKISLGTQTWTFRVRAVVLSDEHNIAEGEVVLDEKICHAKSVHVNIEDEIVYPSSNNIIVLTSENENLTGVMFIIEETNSDIFIHMRWCPQLRA